MSDIEPQKTWALYDKHGRLDKIWMDRTAASLACEFSVEINHMGYRLMPVTITPRDQ